MVRSAVEAPSIEAVEGLPARVVIHLRKALSGAKPSSPAEIELLAREVALAKLPSEIKTFEREVARCENLVVVAPSISELLLSLEAESKAKRQLDAAEAIMRAIFDWAHRLVCELCAASLFVPAGPNKLRPCDEFPFPPTDTDPN